MAIDQLLDVGDDKGRGAVSRQVYAGRAASSTAVQGLVVVY